MISRFRQKFKSFVEQYELRELHFHSLMRTKDCEIQLSQSRFDEQRKRAEVEANKARQLTGQVSTFTQTESELRSQLNIYVEKFKQVSSLFSNYFLPFALRPTSACHVVHSFPLMHKHRFTWLYLIQSCNPGGGYTQQLQ